VEGIITHSDSSSETLKNLTHIIDVHFNVPTLACLKNQIMILGIISAMRFIIPTLWAPRTMAMAMAMDTSVARFIIPTLWARTTMAMAVGTNAVLSIVPTLKDPRELTINMGIQTRKSSVWQIHLHLQDVVFNIPTREYLKTTTPRRNDSRSRLSKVMVRHSHKNQILRRSSKHAIFTLRTRVCRRRLPMATIGVSSNSSSSSPDNSTLLVIMGKN
jgi:selenocysteine lyase/cysteine desulfurase